MFRKAVLFIVLSLVLSLAEAVEAEKVIVKGNNEVDELIQDLMLGEPVYYKNLTIIPIYSTRIKGTSNYLTLDEAIRKGYITVKEVGGGRVPQLRVDNNSNRLIFFMSGEILTGGKQDRFVGEDLLLGPWRKGMTLPVYCSERGRWTFSSDKFESGGIAAAPSLRQKILEKKDQAEIWEGIREESEKLGASSSTEAFKDVYVAENVDKEMKSYLRRFESVPQLHKNTIGVAVGIRGTIVAIDIFSSPDLFTKLWPKLLKSYALNAFGPASPTQLYDPRSEVREVLNRIYRAREDRRNALDLGETIKINTDGMAASALVYRREVVHLSALPSETSSIPSGTIPVIE